MEMAKRNFSDIVRRSGEVLKVSESGQDVLLQRRDGADLMLVPAEREEGIRDSLRTAASLLLAGLEGDAARKALTAKAPGTLPWLRLLPVEWHAQFLREFAETAQAAVDTGAFGALGQLERSWNVTARLYAEPVMREWLLEPIDINPEYGHRRLRELKKVGVQRQPKAAASTRPGKTGRHRLGSQAQPA